MSLPCYNPKQLEELKHILQAESESLAFLAGGTDLLIQLKEKFKTLSVLVNLSEIKELKKIREKQDNIIIGAMVTHSQIANSSFLKRYAPVLVEACSQIGSLQIRNRATIGGNVGNASPAADSVPALYVHQAKVILLSPDGTIRKIPIEEFFIAPGKTIRKPKELITGLILPKNIRENRENRENKDNNISFYRKLGTRKALIIAKVSVAFIANYNKDEKRLSDVYIALGAVAPTVIRAYETEKFLNENPLTEITLKDASELLTNEAHPISDVRSTADYRKKMVGVLLKQGLESLI